MFTRARAAAILCAVRYTEYESLSCLKAELGFENSLEFEMLESQRDSGTGISLSPMVLPLL
jgi:hypothetical protein